jgi:hypothetical protein
MGLSNSPDIFQEKISELMLGLDFVRAYIDDILILTQKDWKDHLTKLALVFEQIQSTGLKVNAVKSFFRQKFSQISWLLDHPSRHPTTP